LNGTSTELAFWFFLIDQGPEKRDWFTSWEYKFWFLGPSLLFSALCCPSEPGSNGLSRLASAATILGMPFTTLVARNDIVTVNTFPLYFALPLDYSPDRCMDLPHRFLDLHGDQHSLHFHSRPLSCLPSPRYSRGRRSHRRRSPCHFLRAQCWFFPAFLIPCFDFLQQSRCSSSQSMAFAVRTQSTTACGSRLMIHISSIC
jgi:hypothetical protein